MRECPSCRQPLRVPSWLAGGDVRCPACAAVFPDAEPAPAGELPALRPHRGVLLLILGLAGLMPCGFTGPFAWVLGERDLEDMRRGLIDPEGESLTSTGRVLGMIGTILMLALFFCGGPALLALMAGGR